MKDALRFFAGGLLGGVTLFFATPAVLLGGIVWSLMLMEPYPEPALLPALLFGAALGGTMLATIVVAAIGMAILDWAGDGTF